MVIAFYHRYDSTTLDKPYDKHDYYICKLTDFGWVSRELFVQHFVMIERLNVLFDELHGFIMIAYYITLIILILSKGGLILKQDTYFILCIKYIRNIFVRC